MEPHNIHKVQFYIPEPKCIINMSYSRQDNLVAVLRSDNRVEIWNIDAAPFIQNTILLNQESKIKKIVWVGQRLFGSCLDGFVKELDLYTSREKKSYSITSGGPCHCIAANKSNTLIAVGTEFGFINIFEVEENNLLFVKILQLVNTSKTSNRILSVVWDSSGNYIIASGFGFIKVFDYNKNRILHDLKLDKLSKKKIAIVWSVEVTDDFEIVAGDSSGHLSIWDGRNGVCIDRIRTHVSDILTVSLSQNQQTIYCAGIDPVIKSYNRIVFKDNTTKWVKSKELVNHLNDVNSVFQLNNGHICSGGVDTYLSVSRVLPYKVKVYPALYQSPSVYIAKEARCMLLRYSTYLQFWYLRCISNSTAPDPLFVFELKSYKNEPIKCADISSDGHLVCYSTINTFRVIHFAFNGQPNPSLKPLSLEDFSLEKVNHVCFSKDNKKLVVSDGVTKIQVFSTKIDDDSSKLKLLYSISLTDDKKWSDNIITMMAVSYNCSYIAVVGNNGLIGVLNNHKFHAFLPKYDLHATALSFHPKENLICVVYADFTLKEYSVDELHYTFFSKTYNPFLLEKYLSSKNQAVTRITFDHDNNDIIIFHTASNICVINKNQVSNIKHNKKRIKLDTNDDDSTFPKNNKKKMRYIDFKDSFINLKAFFQSEPVINDKDISKDYGLRVYGKRQHLVHFECLGSKEMVCVEISPEKFLIGLPAALKKKEFGRK